MTSTDYVPALLESARLRALAEGLQVQFETADAEQLPYAEAEFDAVMSTFGVMFTADHAKAAAEMLRVCRPGGRIGLANWTPTSFIGKVFALVGRYVPPAAGVPSPALWGDSCYLRELFGHGVDEIRTELRDFSFGYRSPRHWIEVFRQYYGPINRLYAVLSEADQQAFTASFLAMSPTLTFLMVAVALVAAARAFVLPALLRPGLRAEVSRSRLNAEIYRQQLAEIEGDRALGLVGVHEAERASDELKRRLLADTRPDPAASARGGRRAAIVVAAAVPVAASLLYLAFGSPRALDRASSGVAGESPAPAAAELAAHLRDHPGDARAWVMLARGKMELDEFAVRRVSPGKNIISSIAHQNTALVSSLYQSRSAAQESDCSSILCFAPKHFLHNTLMSLLFLPTSPVWDDLWHTVKDVHLYWRADWDGTLDVTSLFFLAVNLFIIALGISVLWKHQRLSGTFPLAAFMIYNLSNAVARTSGGRYIVPMDWILALYFMAGILFLFTEAARITRLKHISLFDQENDGRDETEQAGSYTRKAILALVVLFAIGSLVPLSEKLNSPRYAGVDIPNTLQERGAQIEEADLDLEQVHAFLQTPGAEARVGRTLYPRSYKMGQGEVSFYFYPFTIMDFPRTGFFLIGPHGKDNILLPGGTPEYLPHAADALVIGCREQNYVDALMVILLEENGAVYTRSPMPELACPMEQPVCEDNSTCQ